MVDVTIVYYSYEKKGGYKATKITSGNPWFFCIHLVKFLHPMAWLQ